MAASPPSRYVRLDIDLVHEMFQRRGVPLLRSLEAIFREREVVEVEGLLRLTAATFRALQRRGFSRVDHWEVRPGGWLPLPEPAHERLAEPVGHLLNALRSDAWRRVAHARAFSARLSTGGDLRADVTIRQVHRERGHAITLELFGTVAPKDLLGIERGLRDELTIVRLRRTRTRPLSATSE
ncbi:MAG TPA: hypothetical protein VEG66_07100 [Thermoplasmata archaeon]|nr:hypothetical protein [Thermoplasmata archaeon]